MKTVLIRFALAWLTAGAALGGEDHMMLKGLAYGPFRDGQRPGVAYPSGEEIRADLELMRRITPKIRTYGMEGILGQIPGYCAELGLDCYPGAWIDRDLPSNDQQIQTLLAVADRGYPTTKGLIVGNEVLLRGDLPQSNLVSYINAVKASTRLPVTTAEPFYLFLDEAYDPVASAVDFLCIHIHPWWFNVHITNAVPMTYEAYTLVRNRWPDKEIIIGEIGWPSGGSFQDPADPSPQNAGYFLGGFQAVARWLDMDYFYFSAFDEAWKVEPFGVGPHWGIMNTDRTPKDGLNEMVAYYTSILDAGTQSITFHTFEQAAYEIQRTDSLVSPDWTVLDVIVGAADTNETTYLPGPAWSPAGAYRSRWIPD